MTNVVAIIQSRQGSSRLPGKALKPLYKNKGALALMLERITPSKRVNQFVVATTQCPEDDAIEALCKTLNTAYFRGSESDVLDRYYQAALAFNATHVVRLTGDCPIQDYQVIDDLVGAFFKTELDYLANAIKPTYPDGFDAEIFTLKTLETLHQKASKPSDREHVTPFVHRHPEQFKFQNFPYKTDVSQLRLTLDTPEDFQLLTELCPFIFGNEKYIHLDEILNYLSQNPHLLEINHSQQRNEGYLKSLKNDLK